MTGFRQPKRARELIVETGTTLTLSAGDAGKTICNVGASGVLGVTLPAASACRPGDDFMFLSCADQNFTITAANAGELITLNDIAANSVALSTSSEKAGGAILITCVSSTKFHCAFLTEETQTVTVAT